MDLTFSPLLKEAERPEYSRWQRLLRHLALLHESSMYDHPSSPAPYPLETLGPGYYFNPAFSHWDLTYSLLDSCPVMPEHTLRQLENMLCFQREDGSLAGAIFFRGVDPVPHSYSNFPPVWPLAVDDYSRTTGSDRAVKLAIEPLLRQLAYFERERQADGYGFFYNDTVEPKSWESGIDDSVRCEIVQERGKFPCVDATCHIRFCYDAASRYLTMLGRDGSEFAKKRDALDELIRTRFYSDETGYFHDGYLLDRGIKYRALTGVWALTCGAATEEQANRVIDESLLDPERFFTAHPLPFIAANEPGFALRMWRGGAWNSWTYMAILGCLRYNRKDAAVKIAEKALDMSLKAYERSGAIWEFYHPFGDHPSAMGRKKPPYQTPAREYCGQNPLFALARIVTGEKETF